MNYKYFLITGLIIVSSLLIKENKNNKVLTLIKKYHLVMLFIIIVSSIFLYLYKVDSIPVGLNVDEAGMAYDAFSLARFGVDRFLYKNPVYFINYGSGQNSLYTYIISLFFRHFDYSLFLIRIPAVIFGVLSIVFLYKIIKENKDTSSAVLTILITLITPFFIMKSRWALESYLFLPMLIISLYYYMHALNTSKKRYFFLAGLLFGITLYTYAISYIIIFVFVIVNSLYLLINKKITINNLIIFGIPLFFLALPLVLMLLINNNVIPNEIRTKYFSIPKLIYYRGNELSVANIKNNLDHFYILYVIFKQDNCIWNSIPLLGTLYNISELLIIPGLIISLTNVFRGIRKKEFYIDIPIFIIFITMFILSLFLLEPNINKINCLYLPLIYYIGLGVEYIFKKSDVFGLIILSLYFVCFANFSNYYFNGYASNIKDTVHFLSSDFYDALYFDKKKSQNNKIINIDGSIILQPYIYVLLAEKIDPYTFNKYVEMEQDMVIKYKNYLFYIDDFQDNKKIYITRSEININMKVKRFGAYNVDYLDTSIL